MNKRKCNCGRFLGKKDKDICKVCQLEKTINELRNEKWKCQTKNKELMTKVETLESKKKFPFFIHIKETYWNISESYLNKIIQAIAPFSDVFQVEWGQNKN